MRLDAAGLRSSTGVVLLLGHRGLDMKPAVVAWQRFMLIHYQLDNALLLWTKAYIIIEYEKRRLVSRPSDVQLLA